MHAFMNGHEELLDCQDLCNGGKHLTITGKQVDDNPWLGRGFYGDHDEITFVRAGGDHFLPHRFG